jgi:hypothetical protein
MVKPLVDEASMGETAFGALPDITEGSMEGRRRSTSVDLYGKHTS